ncbi:unnamed protein product [Cuscuta campestris]|uniref:Uncharacterized protein n=1 Tax=Cuscuta campestris TaxID=132261 RepID=A0A484M7A4_9ASTE|nr:unnamed protein product [Cuscuta campestris]
MAASVEKRNGKSGGNGEKKPSGENENGRLGEKQKHLPDLGSSFQSRPNRQKCGNGGVVASVKKHGSEKTVESIRSRYSTHPSTGEMLNMIDANVKDVLEITRRIESRVLGQEGGVGGGGPGKGGVGGGGVAASVE